VPINLRNMTSTVLRSEDSLSVPESLSRMTNCMVFLGELTTSVICFCWIPFFAQNLSKTWMPFGVRCQTEPFIVNSFACFPSADSTNRASKKRWHTDRAISRAIENVVVVVVVTILDGSLGSGIRFDCENLREPRLFIPSSERKEWSTLVNRTRWGANGRLTTNVANKSVKSFQILVHSS
jgi:hypothetical protein